MTARHSNQDSPRPIAPCALDHVVIETADIHRSLAFYQDVLGMESVRLDEFRSGQAGFVSLRVGDSLIDLFPSEHPGPGPHHVCLEFDCPIEDLVKVLAGQGIPFDPPQWRFGARGMGHSVYVKDPDGHVVELRTYHQPLSK